jgi:hypothetical protein
MDDADGLVRARGRKAPLLDDFVDVRRAEQSFGGIKAPAGEVMVVHRPIGGIERVAFGRGPVIRRSDTAGEE